MRTSTFFGQKACYFGFIIHISIIDDKKSSIASDKVLQSSCILYRILKYVRLYGNSFFGRLSHLFHLKRNFIGKISISFSTSAYSLSKKISRYNSISDCIFSIFEYTLASSFFPYSKLTFFQLHNISANTKLDRARFLNFTTTFCHSYSLRVPISFAKIPYTPRFLGKTTLHSFAKGAQHTASLAQL